MKSLHKEILPDGLLEILTTLNSNPDFKNFYLAGGTALALQLRHRQSIDLDFFSAVEFKSNLVTKIKLPHQVMSLSDNSIELIIQDNKLFFFYFAFALKYEVEVIQKIRLANPIDIGLMKLLALQGRTTRKDIIDLFFIDKLVIKLEDLLSLFEKHYPKESFNSYSSIKKLINISELEAQPMPIMLMEGEWEDIRDLVIKKVMNHLKKSIA